MPTQIVVTLATDAHDKKKKGLVFEAPEWRAVLSVASRGGHSLNSEAIIGWFDARLMATAIRCGAAQGEPEQVDGTRDPNRLKVLIDKLLAMLDVGSVTISQQPKIW